MIILQKKNEISERRTKQQFGIMAAASRMAYDRHQFRGDIWGFWAATSEEDNNYALRRRRKQRNELMTFIH